MFDVATLKTTELTPAALETILLKDEQAECPVYHRFGPGIYIRELHMTAGTVAVGKVQKFEHVNILLKGKVMMFDNDQVTTLEAPLFFIGKPGRKAGFVLEDMVWQNIYATDETDISKLEEMFMEDSEAGSTYRMSMSEYAQLEAQNDRDDYALFLNEVGMTEEEVWAQASITKDMVEYDAPNTLRVADSVIHGKGVFTTAPIAAGEYIAKARIGDSRTPAGRYTNHSCLPNCEFVKLDGDIYLKALVDISGCLGGSVGTELTVDYRNAVAVNPELTNRGK
jgi:hypothetical protein